MGEVEVVGGEVVEIWCCGGAVSVGERGEDQEGQEQGRRHCCGGDTSSVKEWTVDGPGNDWIGDGDKRGELGGQCSDYYTTRGEADNQLVRPRNALGCIPDSGWSQSQGVVLLHEIELNRTSCVSGRGLALNHLAWRTNLPGAALRNSRLADIRDTRKPLVSVSLDT